MRLSFLIFTKIAKLNTCEMRDNHQIVKLSTHKRFFPLAKLSTCEMLDNQQIVKLSTHKKFFSTLEIKYP